MSPDATKPDESLTDPLADLLDVLDLRPADDVSAAEAGAAGQGAEHLPPVDDVFIGRSQAMPHGRVFGGQVVAQSVIAAGRTVRDLDGPERHVHSLHGYFLRPGDANEPLRFEVERLHDGGSFSQRRVHAIQYGRPILSMIFSFQLPADGMDHHDPMPAVPMPEDVPSIAERLEKLPADVASGWRRRRAIDMRHVEGPVYLTPSEQRVSTQNVWIRTNGTLPDDPLIHAAVLAYASDYTILESTLRRHGLAWNDPRLRPASLDHAMWFHRPVRADEWVLYTQWSPTASGGRGLGFGRMFRRDGVHAATVAQEGMIRVKES